MNKLTCCIVLLFLSTLLCAQWSYDPFVPNTLPDSSFIQGYPRSCITSNGDTYFVWSVYLPQTYEDNIWLMRYNAQGVAQWDSTLLVATTGHTSAGYAITADQQGNAVIVYNDKRTPLDNLIVTKISPDGQRLWGNNGVTLSTIEYYPEGMQYRPTLCCTTNNHIFVAWVYKYGHNRIKYAALNPDGSLAYPVQYGDNNTNISQTKPQVLAAPAGACYLTYLTSKTDNSGYCNLWTTLITANGLPAIGFPLCINNLEQIRGIDSGLSVASDGADGMLVTWCDPRYRTKRNIYLQHVFSDGTIAFSPNGRSVTWDRTYHHKNPQMCYDAANQSIYLMWLKSNTGDDLTGIQLQKLNLSGEGQWGDRGIQYTPLTGLGTTLLASTVRNGSFIITYTEKLSYTSIKAMAFNANALPLWQNGEIVIANDPSEKCGESVTFSDGCAVVSWEAYLPAHFNHFMRFNYDGSLGYTPQPPHSLEVELLNDNIVHLSWQVAQSPYAVQGYRIYRDNELIAEITTAEQEYTDVVPVPPGPLAYTYYVTAVWPNGVSVPSNEVTVTITANNDPAVSPALNLTAYPNPFSSELSLRLTGAKKTRTISVYNLLGQRVNTLTMADNSHNVHWDGTDSRGEACSPGIYFLRYEQDNHTLSRKVVKL